MTAPIDLRLHRPAIERGQIDDLRRRLFGQAPDLPHIPGYEVEARLGRGAFGQVYRAFDPRFGRPVAIKVVKVDSVSARVRVEREAHALARLSHPNVVQVYDKGPAGDDAYFLALEYIEGPSLDRWLEEAPRTLDQILAKFLDVARGLAAAHASGLVHRDFKPANAIVGTDGRVRVLDFGLVRALEDPSTQDDIESAALGATEQNSALRLVSDDELLADDPPSSPQRARARFEQRLTKDGRFVGTPFYAAPEQYEGRADARSDQFSFFVALYEAIYGCRPLPASRHHNRWKPPIRARTGSGRVRRLPAWLRRLVRRGLLFDPARRHPDMGTVAEALHLRLTRGPALARGATLAGAAALVTVSLLGAAGLFDRSDIERCRSDRAGAPLPWVEHHVTLRNADHRVADTLGDYASRWTEYRQAACHAEPEVRAEVDACLDEGELRLRELTGWLATADRRAWDRLRGHPGPSVLAGLVATMPDPTRCVAGNEPRATPEHREGWRDLLAAKVALEDRALDTAAEHASRAAEHGRTLGDRALLTTAEYQQLLISAQRGGSWAPRSVLGLLVQALDAGERTLAADIATTTMTLSSGGILSVDLDAVPALSTRDLARLADELAALRAVERAPNADPLVIAWLRFAEGHASSDLGDHAGARELYREAANRLAQVEPPLPAHVVAAIEIHEAAAMATQQPPLRAALPLATQALALRRTELGPEHPEVGRETLAVGKIFMALEDIEGALRHYQEAERIFEARDLRADLAFVRGEVVHVHWLAARRARAQAKSAERDGEDAAPHWARFEQQRHLALDHTLRLEQQLPAPFTAVDPSEPTRPHAQARLWLVMQASYLYHPDCWNESLEVGHRLEQTCAGLDGNESSCTRGREILRSMLERGVVDRSEHTCQADPERIASNGGLGGSKKFDAPSK